MKEPYPQFNVRLSDELRALIKEAAQKNRRSQAAEVESRLLESFAREDAAKGERPIAPNVAEGADVRELVVMMEMVSGQLDLIRRELDARMKGLASDPGDGD
ncbi:Arc family DNA-binding protein [Chromohalobacter salexigens]|nr:Arc family DNA-binding protein [Chromohalobacter salexigens]